MTKRILVIEDHEDNRAILRDMLSLAGYGVLEAVNGAAGVAMAQAEKPDLILMDIQMPVMDGYEAGSCETPSPSVVLVLADVSRHRLATAMRCQSVTSAADRLCGRCRRLAS